MTFGLWRAQDPQVLTDKDGEPVTDKQGNIKERKPMAFDGLVQRELRLHEAIKYVAENPEEFK